MLVWNDEADDVYLSELDSKVKHENSNLYSLNSKTNYSIWENSYGWFDKWT